MLIMFNSHFCEFFEMSLWKDFLVYLLKLFLCYSSGKGN